METALDDVEASADAESDDFLHSYQHEHAEAAGTFDDEDEELLSLFSPSRLPTTVETVFHSKLTFPSAADKNGSSVDWRTMLSVVVFVGGLISFLLAYSKGPRITPAIIPFSVPSRMPLSLSKAPILNAADADIIAGSTTTEVPVVVKTVSPTLSPRTSTPTNVPSSTTRPTNSPLYPSMYPTTTTLSPSTSSPTKAPSSAPLTTIRPTNSPVNPSMNPTMTATTTATATATAITTATVTVSISLRPSTSTLVLIPTVTANLPVPSITTDSSSATNVDNPTTTSTTTPATTTTTENADDTNASDDGGEFRLTSSLLNGYMDSQYTCTDENGSKQDGISPPLQWSNPPPNTVEYLLTMSSIYGKTGTEKFNWVVYGIDGTARAIEEDCTLMDGCSVGVIGGTYPGE